MQPADPPIPPPRPLPPMPSRKRGRGPTKGDDPAPDEAAPPRKPSPPLGSGSRRARNHVPPSLGVGGDGREEGVDFVSHLPDAVLRIIISLLPSKDGAGDLAPGANGAALAVLLTQILLAHAGPVRRFCIPAQQIHERPAMVEGWLTSPRFNNLEELEFTEDLCYMRQLLPLPPSIFRFSNTLRVAAFSQCRVPDCTDLMLQFPHLKLLSLRQVKISETSLHSIIAGCPALEGLLLRNSYGFRCLRINSPTIRSVAFHSPYCWSHGDGEVCYHLEDVIVEFAPCLEKLLHIEQSVGLGVWLWHPNWRHWASLTMLKTAIPYSISAR
uniref:F-box/LRR-repeat protein 15/At3g58940/PEG3-like LRR domain-containing protein n=1 Tax=Oryza glaberrima TaxID=4538 RepID=I1Q9R2_ORYGL